jgi:hypothetical protein
VNTQLLPRTNPVTLKRNMLKISNNPTDVGVGERLIGILFPCSVLQKKPFNDKALFF